MLYCEHTDYNPACLLYLAKNIAQFPHLNELGLVCDPSFFTVEKEGWVFIDPNDTFSYFQWFSFNHCSSYRKNGAVSHFIMGVHCTT